MVMRSFLAEIVDGRLVLPEDALALLPTGTRLRVITDSERQTVCIHGKDPMAPLSPQTQALLDALGELGAGTDADYFAPVTEEMLLEIKRKRRERGAGS